MNATLCELSAQLSAENTYPYVAAIFAIANTGLCIAFGHLAYQFGTMATIDTDIGEMLSVYTMSQCVQLVIGIGRLSLNVYAMNHKPCGLVMSIRRCMFVELPTFYMLTFMRYVWLAIAVNKLVSSYRHLRDNRYASAPFSRRTIVLVSCMLAAVQTSLPLGYSLDDVNENKMLPICAPYTVMNTKSVWILLPTIIGVIVDVILPFMFWFILRINQRIRQLFSCHGSAQTLDMRVSLKRNIAVARLLLLVTTAHIVPFFILMRMKDVLVDSAIDQMDKFVAYNGMIVVHILMVAVRAGILYRGRRAMRMGDTVIGPRTAQSTTTTVRLIAGPSTERVEFVTLDATATAYFNELATAWKM